MHGDVCKTQMIVAERLSPTQFGQGCVRICVASENAKKLLDLVSDAVKNGAFRSRTLRHFLKQGFYSTGVMQRA